MQQTIETRELFELDAIDGVVRGTYHKAHNESSRPLSDLTEERIGVVFLNSLTPTRAATGDSAVYWAEFRRTRLSSFVLIHLETRLRTSYRAT